MRSPLPATETGRRVIVLSLSLVVALGVMACGSEKDGGSGSNISCGVGQLYDPATQKCVDNPNADAGKLSDGASSSSGGSSGGSSSGGESDVKEKELPWALDDSGGIKKDTSGPFDPWWECPPEKKNPKGKQHGQKCEKHADCMYGQCFAGGPLAAYDSSVKYCTKNNGCGSGKTVDCSLDNGGGKLFYPGFEKSKSGGNPKRDPSKDVHKVCALYCKSDSDCKAWNPELPHCLKTSNKYLSFGNPICGKDPDK